LDEAVRNRTGKTADVQIRELWPYMSCKRKDTETALKLRLMWLAQVKEYQEN
jgi:hypothetical protein